MSQAKTSNRERAPMMAESIDAFRAVFGDVKVLYVREGDFEIGDNAKAETASCYYGGTGQLLSDLQKQEKKAA